MSYTPIALILGSDGKFAKVRLYNFRAANTYDVWLLGEKLVEIHSAVTPNKFEGYAGEFPSYVNKHWLIFERHRMPILDMYNNVVEDGLHIVKSGTYSFQVTSLSDKAQLDVVDAFGETARYPLDMLFKLARKDRDCRLFHNLDYSRLGTAPDSLLGAYARDWQEIDIPESRLSVDLAKIRNPSTMGNYDIDLTGYFTPSATMFQSSQTIIPDDWWSVRFRLAYSEVKAIVFPEEMYGLSIIIEDCPQLESLVLPKVVYRRAYPNGLRVSVLGCAKLREIILPGDCNFGTINIHDCESLRSIRAYPHGSWAKGTFLHNRMVITHNCHNLQVKGRKEWTVAEVHH